MVSFLHWLGSDLKVFGGYLTLKQMEQRIGRKGKLILAIKSGECKASLHKQKVLQEGTVYKICLQRLHSCDHSFDKKNNLKK